MTCLSSMDVKIMTRANSDKREYALTILARMLVCDYLGEIDRGEAGPEIGMSSMSETKPGLLVVPRSYPGIRSLVRDTE